MEEINCKRLSLHKAKRVLRRYQRPTLVRQVIVANRVRNLNTRFHYSMDSIHEAIANDTQNSCKTLQSKAPAQLVFGILTALYGCAMIGTVPKQEGKRPVNILNIIIAACALHGRLSRRQAVG